jgi:hypothetical protein
MICIRTMVLLVVLGSACICFGAFGAMGDSMTDEYMDYAPSHNAYNWLEQLVISRSVDFGLPFSSDSRGEPRNKGFANNWARCGATTNTMVNYFNEHIGLGNQIAAGDVSLAFLMIGSNDFAPYFSGYNWIYNGNDPSDIVNPAVQNVKTAVDYILGINSEVKLVLATIPDWETSPAIRSQYSIPSQRALVSNAIADYNAQLKAMVSDHPGRIEIADIHQISLNWIADINAGQNISLNGFELNLNGIGDDPSNLILCDNIHPGTIAQGLLANEFIRAANTFGADIAPLTNSEILQMAGVPEPATLSLLVLGGLALLRWPKA